MPGSGTRPVVLQRAPLASAGSLPTHVSLVNPSCPSMLAVSRLERILNRVPGHPPEDM